MITRTRLTLSAAALALVGAVGVTAQPAERAGPIARGDADGDGNLTRAEAMAQAEAQFARMDANRDGRISSADREAAQEAREERRFDRMDADDNGAISRSEYDAAGDARDARRAERRAQRGGEARQRSGEAPRQARRMARGGGPMMMLRMADTNGDQAIDRAEFMTAAETRFARADADSNGVVTAAERTAAMAAMRAAMRDRRGPEGMPPPPPMADDD